MRIFRALLGMSVAGACALAVLPGVALAAPTAPYTVLTVNLGLHEPTPVSGSAVYDSSNATMDAAASAGDWLRLTAILPDRYVRIDTAAPAGQTWTAGQTYPTVRAGRAAGEALFDMSTAGNGCAYGSGSITVRQVTRDADTGLMTAFAASYEFRCDRDVEMMTGELRWNSPVDYVAPVADPGRLNFGSVDVAEQRSRIVRVRSLGSTPSTFGAAGIAGEHATKFAVTDDTCAGRTLTAGAECTVTVMSKATTPGRFVAALRLPDNSSTGHWSIPVEVSAIRSVVGTYYPMTTPTRIMDTRTGIGTVKGRIGAGRTAFLQVAGRDTLPRNGIGAVVLNVTVVGPTANGFVTVHPAGEALPTASTINFAKGWLGSNNTTVKLGATGALSVYNRNGETDVVIDVIGFYAGDETIMFERGMGGQVQWYEPYRVMDTRTRGLIPAGGEFNAWIDFHTYNPKVRGLILNITAVNPQQAGFLTSWSGEVPRPNASTVNYGAGKVVPNLAYVRTAPCPEGSCNGATGAARYRFYTSATTHIVVDLVGVVDDGTEVDGMRFTPMSPTRIVDSRIGQGLPTALGAHEAGKVTAPAAMLTDATQVLAMNVTAVAPTTNTVVTVWPADTGRAKPNASNLNPAPGQVVSNGVLGVLGPQDAFYVDNLSGRTHLVADVTGTFQVYPGTAAGSRRAGRPAVAGSGWTPSTS
ncbi:hypothetical protein [Micromonospora sp. WMMD714]|uniref:hypothetical protein n=1 Tax=Micromonospora sp. WMMD714 TaxID=3016097 RepID=UPI00249A6138|nr:hypothetical protein [Micromonospora sp. WMMD714]WFE63383.1 hypothetical protein O7625_08855 [Micromonospora sp. WMMD714]